MAAGEDIGEAGAPETNMEAALTSGSPPKKNQPPTILPNIVELQEEDVLAKGKGVQGDVFSSSILEEYIPRFAVLNRHTVDLICRHVFYVAVQDGSYRGLQHQPKDMEYAQKIENFIMKQEDSSLHEILYKEMDPVFLRQLLEDILDSQESSLEAGAPETNMEAALTSGSPPKKNQPPTILLNIVELQEDDVLAKGKGVQGDVFSSSILEEYIPRFAVLNRHTVDLICRHVFYVAVQDGSYRGLQHQPKDMEYAQKIENFIMKQEDSSLHEILYKEMDPVFLRQLLEDILDSQESSLDAEEGGISPDPALAALAAAPSCHRRGNADELFAPIP